MHHAMVNVLPEADGSIGCQVRSFFHPFSTRPSHYECSNRAFHGYLCVDHAKKYYHVEVKQSKLSDAGLGLFATQRINESTLICPYLGPVVSRQQFDLAPSDYGLEAVVGEIINPTRSWDCFARFANDLHLSEPLAVNNCYFLSESDIGRMFCSFQGSKKKIWLVAKRDIARGEELYADYIDIADN